jgi:hypothetical protein
MKSKIFIPLIIFFSFNLNIFAENFIPVNQEKSFIPCQENITIPKMFSYQGKITDTLGNPIPDTIYSLTFRLYTQPTGGSPFWNETQQVNVKNGLFSVLLGAINPIESVPSSGTIYLSLQIANQQELTPRLRIVSSPYSYIANRSAIADSAFGTSRISGLNITDLDNRYVNENQANSVTSSMIVDGTILGQDLNQMGANINQVLKWNGTTWQPANDEVGGDNAWVRGTPDSVLYTIRQLGIARGGANNMLYGSNRFTHVNLGVACTTGTYGQNYGFCTVGGGYGNRAESSFTTIAGGYGNITQGSYSTIGGGHDNRTLYPCATVAGGDSNFAVAYSAVGGGKRNQALVTTATIGGGYNNIAWGYYGVIGGGYHNYLGEYDCPTIGGGRYNFAGVQYTTVSGGYGNYVSGFSSTIGGGYADTVKANYGGILSGYSNLAGDGPEDTAAMVGGGYNNLASAKYATVGGGYTNTASGEDAVVAGGAYNTASSYYATVSGGYTNTASGHYATVSGGHGDTASGYWATVGGGYINIASAYYATVSGGYRNIASGEDAVVAGGLSNTASSYYAVVGGGVGNTASGNAATVGGGWYNTAPGYFATVAGGYGNTASSYYATVSGGYADTAAADHSFAVGYHSVVPTGYLNSAAFNGQTATASNQLRCGTLSKAGGTFTIDHPLDPYNKILNHYFIEGPEMRNLYDGEVILDASGRATVHLPDYFSILNRKPRIQLTGVGTSDVYVLEDIKGNTFVIGGKPKTKVYWQVTGERADVSAEAIRRLMPVEQLKTGALSGRMLDDEFLSGCMEQLEREGKAQGINFRTNEGRKRYEEMKKLPKIKEK